MIVVIVIASHGSQYFSTTADSADTAKITLAETSASGSSVHALAQPSSTNQTSVIRPALSEPLLLLLMGALLIAVGASINRLTKLRRRTHAADARQT